jgi:hypothetical protein
MSVIRPPSRSDASASDGGPRLDDGTPSNLPWATRAALPSFMVNRQSRATAVKRAVGCTAGRSRDSWGAYVSDSERLWMMRRCARVCRLCRRVRMQLVVHACNVCTANHPCCFRLSSRVTVIVCVRTFVLVGVLCWCVGVGVGVWQSLLATDGACRQLRSLHCLAHPSLVLNRSLIHLLFSSNTTHTYWLVLSSWLVQLMHSFTRPLVRSCRPTLKATTSRSSTPP